MITTLKSEIDESVNFVHTDEDGNIFESRYVKRHPHYFICYLSSHSGCNKGCKFCHLTNTRQTTMNEASITEYITQAASVLTYAASIKDPAKYVKFSFMARGEALANSNVLINDSNISLFCTLARQAHMFGYIPQFCISTIIPKTFKGSLVDTFKVIHPKIYYSMYSANPDFRKKWLPGAMDLDDALRMLKEYQEFTDKVVTIHYSLIKGENDSYDDARELCFKLYEHRLLCDLNIIAFNPANDEYQDSDNKAEYSEQLIDMRLLFCDGIKPIIRDIKWIDRVGFDVKASCGMFVNE